MEGPSSSPEDIITITDINNETFSISRASLQLITPSFSSFYEDSTELNFQELTDTRSQDICKHATKAIILELEKIAQDSLYCPPLDAINYLFEAANCFAHPLILERLTYYGHKYLPVNKQHKLIQAQHYSYTIAELLNEKFFDIKTIIKYQETHHRLYGHWHDGHSYEKLIFEYWLDLSGYNIGSLIGFEELWSQLATLHVPKETIASTKFPPYSVKGCPKKGLVFKIKLNNNALRSIKHLNELLNLFPRLEIIKLNDNPLRLVDDEITNMRSVTIKANNQKHEIFHKAQNALLLKRHILPRTTPSNNTPASLEPGYLSTIGTLISPILIGIGVGATMQAWIHLAAPFLKHFSLNDTQIDTIDDRLSTIVGLTPLAIGVMSSLLKTWHYYKHNRL